MVALTKIRAQKIKLKEKLAGLRPASPIIKTQFLILGRAERAGTCAMGAHGVYTGLLFLPADKAQRALPISLIFRAPPPSNGPTLTQHTGRTRAHPAGARWLESQAQEGAWDRQGAWVLVPRPGP